MPLKTNVYIDGFNLYYGCVRGTPHRWLDIAALCARLLPKNTIHRIRYFTALLTPRINDPQQQNRQEIYIRALRTIPNPAGSHAGRMKSIDIYTILAYVTLGIKPRLELSPYGVRARKG